jgi:hypothetical protein
MIANRIAGRIINISTMKTARTYVGTPHYDASSRWRTYFGLVIGTYATIIELGIQLKG